MQIKKYVHFEDEINIDVNVEDLRGILSESEVKYAEHRAIVTSNISTALRILQSIPEKWMNKFKPEFKKTVIVNLQTAMDFWSKNR